MKEMDFESFKRNFFAAQIWARTRDKGFDWSINQSPAIWPRLNFLTIFRHLTPQSSSISGLQIYGEKDMMEENLW